MPTSIKVRLTLTGSNVDPDAISRVVGLTPNRTWRRGEPRAGSELLFEHDGWVFSTEEEETLEFDFLLKKLLHEVEPRSHRIRKAISMFQLDAEIGCSIYIDDRHAPSVFFGFDALRTIAKLGADVDIDIYC